jgi:hypothetical protein
LFKSVTPENIQDSSNCVKYFFVLFPPQVWLKSRGRRFVMCIVQWAGKSALTTMHPSTGAFMTTAGAIPDRNRGVWLKPCLSPGTMPGGGWNPGKIVFDWSNGTLLEATNAPDHG